MWARREKKTTDLATAKHYRLTSAAMALYLFVIHSELYKWATSALRAAGKQYPNPLTTVHAQTALNPKFIQMLRQQLKFCVRLKPLRGVSCYDPPQFFSSPSLIIPSAPAPQAAAPVTRPATPTTRPPSPMQVDPANVSLPPTAEVTPTHSLQPLPSSPTTAICQPPPVISTEPLRQQLHAFYQSMPISPERAALCQSLKALFNVSLPYRPSS